MNFIPGSKYKKTLDFFMMIFLMDIKISKKDI